MVARMRINGDLAIMLALFSSVFRLLKCSNYAEHNRRKPTGHRTFSLFDRVRAAGVGRISALASGVMLHMIITITLVCASAGCDDVDGLAN